MCVGGSLRKQFLWASRNVAKFSSLSLELVWSEALNPAAHSQWMLICGAMGGSAFTHSSRMWVQNSQGGYCWRACSVPWPSAEITASSSLLNHSVSLRNRTRFSVFFQLMKIHLKSLKTLGCVCVYIYFNDIYVTVGCISWQRVGNNPPLNRCLCREGNSLLSAAVKSNSQQLIGHSFGSQ